MDANNKTGRNAGVQDPSREDRAMQSREAIVSQQVSEKEALAAFEAFDSVLPNLPPIPGFHVCWLSTQNREDSIDTRVRRGYVPVTPEDMAGFSFPSIKTGEYAGMIGVNEMLAYKIPNNLYQHFMVKRHHTDPKEQEGRVKDSYAELLANQRQSGTSIMAGGGRGDLGSVSEFDGVSTLAKPNETPDFISPKIHRRDTGLAL